MSSSTGDDSDIIEWKLAAQQKRASVNALIPTEWCLKNELPNSEQLRDITGTYIHQFLSTQEIDYTEAEAGHILHEIYSGKWKARDVLAAFCHRTALAHQMVNSHSPAYYPVHLSKE
jgi:amidase